MYIQCALLGFLAVRMFARAAATNGTSNTTAAPMYALNSDDSFAFQLEATLSLANGGGASTGEMLRIASQIVPGDFESYYSAFKFVADQIHDVGASVNATKYPVSARDALFRAATYYRSAGFYLHGNPNDTRIKSLWDSQLQDFDKAISLLPIPGERITLQADGFNASVLFYKATSGCDEKRPTILAGSGYDGSQEELYHGLGSQVLARGYNFATYEGPGQPTVRIQQNLGFRPDWWNVVTPVVDYLSHRSDVDMARLALVGVSFGGSLAPIAAAYEHRFAAVLAIDGLYDMRKAIEDQIPAELVTLFNSGNATAFDAVMNQIAASPDTPTELRWLIQHSLWSFNTPSPFEWFTRLGQFNVEALFDKIQRPVFVGSGENDQMTMRQPEQVAKELGSRAYYHLFKTNVGAGEHCQIGAEAQLGQVTMDWLNGIFETEHQ